MVDQFDPGQLRMHLLRRMAEAEVIPREEPCLWTKCYEEVRHYVWSTPPAETPAEGGTSSVPGGASPALLTPTTAPTAAAPGAAEAPLAPSAAVSPAPLPLTRASPGAETKKGLMRALGGHIATAFWNLRQDMRELLFLAFPRGSIFQDPQVETLFQRHQAQPWCLCFDSSTAALGLMMVWDAAVNPSYRVPLVVLFYCACACALLPRKVFLLAVPPSPASRRRWHNALLCLFFLGRCTVCQPLFSTILAYGSKPFSTVQVEAFSSIVALGMTNLSMVFMRLQTLDTLLFCLANGAIFVFWIAYVLQMPLADSLHTAYVGSIVVATVSVRQQHDLEDLERRVFEQELLNLRGVLSRSGDRILRQSTASDFAIGLRALRRSRQHEHLNL